MIKYLKKYNLKIKRMVLINKLKKITQMNKMMMIFNKTFKIKTTKKKKKAMINILMNQRIHILAMIYNYSKNELRNKIKNKIRKIKHKIIN